MSAEHTAHAAHADESQQIDHIHLPDPSIWPIVIALGSTILLAGVVLGLVVLFLGLVMLGAGVIGWVYEDIQIEQRSEGH